MNPVDIHLYIKSHSNDANFNHVINNITPIEGVVQASVNENINKILNITYNPQETSFSKIIYSLNKKGFSSRAIGF